VQPPKAEFDDSRTPVVVREADGVRIVLGSHDYWDPAKPDIQIERRHKGWAIFLHPVGGSDPSGYVYFFDDGRSFVVAERGGATPAIRCRRSCDFVAEIDGSYTDAEEREQIEQCSLCQKKLTPSGDNWEDLCPSCADEVSEFLDEEDLTDDDRDRAIEFLRRNRECREFLHKFRAALREQRE
jgi:hypothetical protein